MNQAHEPQMGKLREMWFGRHQGVPRRVPSMGSKVDTWVGVVQSVLGNFDSSYSISKIINLKHPLFPSAKANQHLMLKPETQLLLPKIARNFKS